MMKKISFTLLLGLVALFSSPSVNAQSSAIINLWENNSNRVVSTYFLSESMIRAAVTVFGDSTWVELTEGARLVVFCTAEKSHEKYDPGLIEQFDQDVVEVGYEEMMTMKDSEGLKTIYQLPNDSSMNRYLVVIDDKEVWMAAELSGPVEIGQLMLQLPKLLKQIENFSIPF
jgi:hypothetical protein